MFLTSKISFAIAFSLLTFIYGCTAEAKLADNSGGNSRVESADAKSSTKGPTIKIDPGSPADTVRAFYQELREKKFCEAIYLTNLRPAVESLTDAELKDFAVDFEAMAQGVPQEVQINGEIVSGELAPATAKLAGGD